MILYERKVNEIAVVLYLSVYQIYECVNAWLLSKIMDSKHLCYICVHRDVKIGL